MRASSLYLHVPFCSSKCPYCAFASAPPREGDEARYLRAIAAEARLRSTGAECLQTIYIGGGTPSVLRPDAWRALLETIEENFDFTPAPEFTVEANPGSLSLAHLRLWRAWGVNRVSLGVQSFDDAELAAIGRVHTASQACDATSALLAAGFSVSVDLMFGLPGGTLRNWARTLRQAVSLRPHHISVYQLSIEPDTPFAANPPALLQDGYAPYRYAQWFLPRHGYRQYEVASFARPGRESRHNLNYWADAPYVGIGPSAWGYENGVRYRNAPSLDDYAAGVARIGTAVVYEERLEGESAARQAAVLALRTTRGIEWKPYRTRFGSEIAAVVRETLASFPRDLVCLTEQGAYLTPKGLRLGNLVWEEII